MTNGATEHDPSEAVGGHRLEFLRREGVEADVLRDCAAELAALLATGASHLALDSSGGRDTVPLVDLESLRRQPFTAISLASRERARLPWSWRVRLAAELDASLTLDVPRAAVAERAAAVATSRSLQLVHLDARTAARHHNAILPAVLLGAQIDPRTFDALAAWAFSRGAFREVRWFSPDALARAWTSFDDVPAGIASAVRLLHGVEVDDTASTVHRSTETAGDDSLAARLTTALGDPAREAEVLASSAGAPVSVVGLAPLDAYRFRAAPRGDVVLVVAPTPDGVQVAVSTSLGAAERSRALLHAVGHVALGHVRPGDRFAIYDTLATLHDERPPRRWDRDVRSTFPSWFEPPSPSSLDECTPRDKAMLGLHRMIRDRLGGAETLHETARKYQHAAYQRQAAQRLVTQLEATRGAMLCDGVGLGKTYVATTVIVHYANVAREEPLRVSILAPGSVVATWTREAVPPLAQHEVDTARIRVISHAKLSRITSGSAFLAPGSEALSDLEHLILSDLVIVDEAHNFRAASARRTRVLRDILRLRVRRGRHRKVLLLTATPINNSLADLEQECSLLFAEPYTFPGNAAKTEHAWDKHVREELAKRCERARAHGGEQRHLIDEILHGPGGRVRSTFAFRSDLHLGTHDLARYLKEQEATLQALRARIRQDAEGTVHDDGPRPRVAEELLDRVVVQRSRDLCKAIEAQEGSKIALLFRRDAGAPEQLRYEDAYGGTHNVLERFLPLFDEGTEALPPLSFSIYRCREVERSPDALAGPSPAVGLQRVLALKRLESSPVTFLVTVLRLTVRHVVEIESMIERATRSGLQAAAADVTRRYRAVLQGVPAEARVQASWLIVGDDKVADIDAFARGVAASKQALDDDAEPRQLGLFDHDARPEQSEERLAVERLLTIHQSVLGDLRTLLGVIPELAAIVFGPFSRDDWPACFAQAEQRWPRSETWAWRLDGDPKLRVLVLRLLAALTDRRKAIVFSQFTDTIAYVRSVLDACRSLPDEARAELLRALDPALALEVFDRLLCEGDTVTGDTEDRDRVIDRFAPFYRLRPYRPSGTLGVEWEGDWREALEKPVNVLFASDVLAEGVNLQDASLLVNFDVHWNPVRMIQRAGRIDRRLDPRIEDGDFPDLYRVAAQLGRDQPRYAWAGREHEAPVVANMILPDALEAQLALRERIATKTLAIDFTLGLEHGTGAEADWMHGYRFRGVASLNAFQQDRAIERLGATHRELEHALARRGVDLAWGDELNAWIRGVDADDAAPLVARAFLNLPQTPPRRYARVLTPRVIRGVPCWLWSQEPFAPLTAQWLPLHLDHVGEAWPAHDADPSATQAVRPEHLLAAVSVVVDPSKTLTERPRDESVGTEVFQGMPALAPGYFASRAERAEIEFDQVFILQHEGVVS